MSTTPQPPRSYGESLKKAKPRKPKAAPVPEPHDEQYEHTHANPEEAFGKPTPAAVPQQQAPVPSTHPNYIKQTDIPINLSSARDMDPRRLGDLLQDEANLLPQQFVEPANLGAQIIGEGHANGHAVGPFSAGSTDIPENHLRVMSLHHDDNPETAPYAQVATYHAPNKQAYSWYRWTHE